MENDTQKTDPNYPPPPTKTSSAYDLKQNKERAEEHMYVQWNDYQQHCTHTILRLCRIN